MRYEFTVLLFRFVGETDTKQSNKHETPHHLQALPLKVTTECLENIARSSYLHSFL